MNKKEELDKGTNEDFIIEYTQNLNSQIKKIKLTLVNVPYYC